MTRHLFILISIICVAFTACKERPTTGGTGGDRGGESPESFERRRAMAMPEKQDGEFFRSLRADPYRTVKIDLRTPSDLSGIPEVRWFPMGDEEFCSIQGTTDTTLILPSGRVIKEEFAIVYVHRDSEGIHRVKADSLGWLKQDVAGKRLDKEVSLLTEDGGDPEVLQGQRREVLDWMANFNGTSLSSSGIGVRKDGYRFNFGFSVIMSLEHGIRYSYDVELQRTNERLAREYEIMRKRAELEKPGKPSE